MGIFGGVGRLPTYLRYGSLTGQDFFCQRSRDRIRGHQGQGVAECPSDLLLSKFSIKVSPGYEYRKILSSRETLRLCAVQEPCRGSVCGTKNASGPMSVNSVVPGGNMKDTSSTDDWRSLCELASKETNPRKLLDLITRINRALEECHRPRSQTDEASFRVDTVLPLVSKSCQYDFDLYRFPGECAVGLEYDC